MAKASKKGQKIWVLILYIIVLLGLLVGLLIPMDFNADKVTDTMLIMQIPSALNAALAPFVTNPVLSGDFAPFILSSGIDITEELSIDVNAWLTLLYALVTLLAVICVIPAAVGATRKKSKEEKAAAKQAKADAKAAKMAAASGEAAEDADDSADAAVADAQAAADPFADAAPFAEAQPEAEGAAVAEEAPVQELQRRETTVHTAFTLEVLAAAVLLLLNFFYLVQVEEGYSYVLYGYGAEAALPVFIALAVAVVAGFIQRAIISGGSGVVKFILFLLSLAAVVLAFFSVYTISMSFATWLKETFAESSLSPYAFGDLFYPYFYYFLFPIAGELFTGEGMVLLLEIAGLIVAIMLLVNCFLDLLGIYKSTNKFMLVVNQIRYIIEIVGIILCVIAALASEDTGSIGIMFLAVCIFAVIAYIINLARLLKYNRAKKKAAAAEEVTDAETEEAAAAEDQGEAQPAYAGQAAVADAYAPYDSTPAPAPAAESYYPAFAAQPAAAPAEAAAPAPVVAAPAPAPAPAPVVATPAYAQPEPTVKASAQEVQNSNVIYNVHTIYNGPTDKFIAKLTNDEKVEFARVFLERLDAPLTVIPEYKVGGENAKFFSNVIIYYARVRDMISDGLMNKIYEEGKLM